MVVVEKSPSVVEVDATSTTLEKDAVVEVDVDETPTEKTEVEEVSSEDE